MAVKLGVAETIDQVRVACAHPETGCYDVFRHIRLREQCTTLYITDRDVVIDGHKHYQQGGGYTEHSIFPRQVIDSNGFLQEIPQGPKSKQKKMPRKMKRSARTKAMLAPPAQKRSSCEPCTAEKRQTVAPAPNPWEVEAFLPGLPHEPNLLPVVSCVGAHRSDTSSQSCWATTKSGGRCMRKRVAGNFCQQHFNEISAQKQQMAFFEEVEDLFDGA